MSNADVSSTFMSYSTYEVLISSSSEDASIQILEANIEGDQEVTQPPGNDETQEIPEADQDRNQPANQQKVIPPEAQRYIGLIICKECSGTKYLGTVVDYNVQRKWFRVEYGDEEFEDLDEESVRKLVAKKSEICAAQAQASGSPSTTKNRGGGSKKNGGEKKKEEASEKRSRNDEGPYIPLAYRETKRDAYYFY